MIGHVQSLALQSTSRDTAIIQDGSPNEQQSRNRHLFGKKRKIATGVSARGLDVQGVNHVINYDLPSPNFGGIQEYIHRNGRTARIGHKGVATSFYTSKDEELAPMLVKLLLENSQTVPDFLTTYIPEGEGGDLGKLVQQR